MSGTDLGSPARSDDSTKPPASRQPPPRPRFKFWHRRPAANTSSDGTPSAASDLDIDDFFRDNDRLQINLEGYIPIIGIITSVLFTLYLIILYYLPQHENEYVFGISQPKLFKVDSALSSLSAACISILASLIAVFFVNKSNVRRLSLVKSLGNEGVLKSIFRVLRAHESKYTESKHVEIVFEDFKTSTDAEQSPHLGSPVLRAHLRV